MGKIAFIFPGQGAQYVGMGKDFYENEEIAAQIFDLAATASGVNVKHICFEENEDINTTEFTQIAMLADEVAILKVIESKGIKCDVTAGLSLGEYGAVVAAGVLSPEDAFALIRKRGIYMQEAYPVGGGMSAILGLSADVIDEVCTSVKSELSKPVSVANYNCPGQIVITGDIDAVTKAGEILKEKGAKRVVPLNVSGPFHSDLLKDASEKLYDAMKDVELSDVKIPYVANMTAEYVTSKDDVKELLKGQICASVRWQQSVEKMAADGVDTFIEIGPGRTLSGFIRKINKDLTVINIDKYEDLAKLDELGKD